MSDLWKGRRPETGRLRVVQWATGKVGACSLRAVIEHPKLDLAGVWVHSAAKEGRDAGELCGLAPVGIKATRDIDAIIALESDCVLYMPEGFQVDELCRLLESGANVITTRGEFHNPARMPAAVRERIEAACQRGGTSIHSVGSSPGFITEALPFVLTSIQRRLDCLTINEYAYMPIGCSSFMLFETLGYGKPLSAFDETRLAGVHDWFVHSLHTVADALSLTLDAFEIKNELAAARSAVQIDGRTIEPGTLAADRITVAGLRNGKPLLRFRAHWYCTKDIDAPWELRDTGWRVQVEGDTPLDVGISFPVAPEHVIETMPRVTAHRPINTIPYLCAAPPGIRTTADLPQIIAHLG
jgi:4-hydroxy-tetrahydrodipicolinate reductase